MVYLDTSFFIKKQSDKTVHGGCLCHLLHYRSEAVCRDCSGKHPCGLWVTAEWPRIARGEISDTSRPRESQTKEKVIKAESKGARPYK